MINLLPPQQKDELAAEERFKILIIFGIVILSFFISLILVLFALKFYFSGQLEVQDIFLKQKIAANPQVGQLEKEMNHLNKVVTDLDSFYKKEYSLTGILDEIIKTIPSGINLNSLNFQLAEGGQYKASLSLSGFSPTRELLLEFKKNLESREVFKEVIFPSSIWVEPINISFTVNFKIIK
jgi:Tfp pilus assembly protein PilN